MAKANVHPDQKYIEGLLMNSPLVIKSIYARFVPKVVGYIKKNSGNEDAAKDVVQEVLVTIYNQAKHKGLQLTCPFDAYFFLLCKRRWLNEIKKSSLKEVTINEEVISINDDALQLADEFEIEKQKKVVFDRMFQKLGDACKDLLKTTFEIKSMEEVAQKLGVTYAYARKKKSLCIGELTRMVQESSEYKNLKA
ncbi:sigma-70 family RNA polymerase sigma factor [Arenibacter sp. TNZ]|jgi:RNA polymerase sigma factor (sigma-70 family)|uniref:RNA polymerase sigma factor n=1 Tax=Arenibacter TaxID=178469 RepID=UPI000CD43BD8|nr:MULTISPECIES: sigma-70 family RNA polymerase sigma factor [Arenibacter]MCM4173950.1 sigma-70 family RNA polymerase sigma factor [Arenibacter sp. TNZ]